MTRSTQITLATIVAALLVLGTPVSAYHWEDEQENEQYMTRAGDESVRADGADCFNATAELDDAHCVVLYGHVFDILNVVPINIQSPASCTPDLARGFSGEVHTGMKNQMFLRSSPGFVEYEEDKCGVQGQDDPDVHPERGLTSDVTISEDVPVTGFWYLSADSGEFSPMGLDEEPSMGVMPCVTVRMQLWTQHYVGLGTLVAEGTTTKTVVSTPEALEEALGPTQDQVDDVCPGSEETVDPEQVTEFRVDMEKQDSLLIPDYEGYVIGVQWYQHDGGDPDDDGNNLMQREWNIHTGSEYPNRIVMAVKDSIRIDRVNVQDFDNKLWIRGSINTPWGSYDVDTKNIRIEVVDEDGNTVIDQDSEYVDDMILQYSVNHDGHFKPVNATLPWDYQAQDLPPGEYTARVTVTNWQHTQDAIGEQTFTITDEGFSPGAAPGPETEVAGGPSALIALVVVLVPLARAWGRRRSP